MAEIQAAPLINTTLSDTMKMPSKLFGRQSVPFRDTFDKSPMPIWNMQ